MKIPLFYIDAFTNEVFKGNPAGVCLLDGWLPDEILQSIATEHNLSETAFLVKKEDTFQIKWFTPKVEASLCGHATLASAHVLFKIYNYGSKPIQLESKSGSLFVKQATDGRITLDFPIYENNQTEAIPETIAIFGTGCIESFTNNSNQHVLVFDSEKTILGLKPDFTKMQQLPFRSVIATATGSDCDFVLRYFAPKVGVNEDPVTGSAQCTLVPFWSKKLGKTKLFSRQLSERGGEIYSELNNGNRVLISGYAIIYMQGTINITIKQQNTLVPFTFEDKK